MREVIKELARHRQAQKMWVGGFADRYRREKKKKKEKREEKSCAPGS
jgi:hypothetical protein